VPVNVSASPSVSFSCVLTPKSETLTSPRLLILWAGRHENQLPVLRRLTMNCDSATKEAACNVQNVGRLDISMYNVQVLVQVGKSSEDLCTVVYGVCACESLLQSMQEPASGGETPNLSGHFGQNVLRQRPVFDHVRKRTVHILQQYAYAALLQSIEQRNSPRASERVSKQGVPPAIW
jgi:hypothetical protein